MFNLRRLATNIGVYTSLLTAGDVVCQQLELEHARKQPGADLEKLKWDPERTKIFLQAGLPMGLLNHTWYTYLDIILPGKTASTVFRKVLCDQFGFAPVMVLSFFTGIIYFYSICLTLFFLYQFVELWKGKSLKKLEMK